MANEIQVAPDRPTLLDRLKSAWDGWYGPSKPIPPVAPDGTQPRQLDYSLVFNQTWMPRHGEKIGFPQLRMMADGNYLMRAIIDKVKERVCSKSWHFRLKPKPGEYMAETKERSNNDPRVQKVTEFFQSPDSEHTFKEWLNMLLEDKIVIDAACLEVQRTRGGGILNLLPIDGATINVLIDNTGRRPKAPLPAFRQIVHGLPATDFVNGIPEDPRFGQLIYMPANVRTNKLYGHSAVETTLALAVTLIFKTVYHQNFYDESNIPMASITMPENLSTAEILRLLREIEAANKGNLEQRTNLLPVPPGGKIEVIKHEEFQVKFEEWCARVFAYILGETATPFIQQNNRATANQADDTREESGEKPLMLWVKDRIDHIVQRPDLFNGADIEFIWDEEAETDALKQAQIDQINVSIGQRTADENRQRDGLSPMWEDSGGNPPVPSMVVEQETEQDEPGDGKSGKPKPKTDGGKAAAAVVKALTEAAQKKTSFRY